MNKRTIVSTVRDISEPIAKDLGYELVDVEFLKEGSNYYLRIYIHKSNGINLDDCQNMSQILSSKLDEEDPISVSYYLEVSSPGLDRPLKTDKDLNRNLGENLEVKLYEALDGKKLIEGILKDFDKNEITITTEFNKIIKIPREVIALIKLAVKF